MSENMKVKTLIKNKTTEELYFKSQHLDHGKWVDIPVNCKAGKTTKAFYAEGAEGSATGVEGWVKYDIGKGDKPPVLKIEFSVPYSGDNSSYTKVSPNDTKYTVVKSTRGDDEYLIDLDMLM